MKIAIKDMFLKQMLNIIKGFKVFIMTYFYQKECKLKNATGLYAICMIKATILYT